MINMPSEEPKKDIINYLRNILFASQVNFGKVSITLMKKILILRIYFIDFKKGKLG